MRFYELLSFQDIILYLFPALIFIVIFGLLLANVHFHTKNSEARKNQIVERFSDGIQGRNAPFPLGMALIILGTVIWGFLYIWLIGVWGIKI